MNSFFFSWFLLIPIVSFGNLKDPYVLAVTEGEPSWNLCRSVNALTGDLFLGRDDIVVNGYEPIHLSRMYISGDGRGKNGGWIFLPHLELYYEHGWQEIPYVVVAEPGGSALCYRSSKKDQTVFTLDVEEDGDGITNTSQGVISAKTNLRNQSVQRVGQHSMIVNCANGGQRCYRMHEDDHTRDQKHKRAKQFVFYLEWERLPNGNYLKFKYDKERRVSYVSSHNPAQTKTYAWVKFHYREDPSHNNNSFIETSDKRHIHYNYEHRKTGEGRVKEFYLTNAAVSDMPEEKYGYNATHDHRGPLVVKRELPHGRGMDFTYYKEGDNQVFGRKIKVDSTEDPRCDRVKTLSAPVGHDGNFLETHRFFYKVLERKKKKNGTYYKYTGTTEVFDIDGNKMLFSFNEGSRPKEVKRFSGQDQLYNAERTTWTRWSDLWCKTLYDENDAPILSRLLSYDSKGNVTEETLYGNLSGLAENQLQIVKGRPKEGSREYYSVRYHYYPDHSMSRREEDNGKVIEYIYLPGTDLILSRLTGDRERIYLREFFEYNSDHILVRTIQDNGSSKEKDNLVGATQRTMQVITPRTAEPALGFPEVIEEKYLDLRTMEEVLLKKTVIHYSEASQIVRQETYDANQQFCYELRTTYDGSGRPRTESNAIGEVKETDYDVFGNKIRSVDPSKRLTTSYTYDFSNRLIATTEECAEGKRVTRQQYDTKHNLIAQMSDYGHEKRFTPDAFGHVSAIKLPSVTDKNGRRLEPVTKKSYDSLGNEISLVDANGDAYFKKYTIRGKPYLIIYPNGSREQFFYNPDGTLRESIDRDGTITRFTYDLFEHITSKSIFSSDGTLLLEEKFAYDAFHLLSKTDAEGNVTAYFYDGAGRKIAEKNGAEETRFTYDALGRVETTQTGDVITQCKYDFLDRVVEKQIVGVEGTEFYRSHIEYDSMGNQCKVTQYTPEGPSSQWTIYDAFRRPREIYDGLGHITRITYDDHFYNALGENVLRKTTIDPLGIRTVEIHDTHDRIALVEKYNPFGEYIARDELFYDLCGNLARKSSLCIDYDGSRKTIDTVWEYGPENKLISLIEAKGTPKEKRTSYSYTLSGRLETITKPSGIILHHRYDALGRLIHLKSSDGTVHIAYTYNNLHQPISIEDHVSGRILTREYDPMGRVLSEDFGSSITLKNAYDLNGRRTRLTLPDESQIDYTYDGMHLASVDRSNPQGELLYSHRYTQYDLSGNLLEQELIGNLGTMTYEVDQMGRTYAVHSPFGTQQVEKYDDFGNVRQVATDGQMSLYDYDAHHQISREKGFFSHAYGYDSHHNRLYKDENHYRVNDLNQIKSTQQSRFVYDDNGNLIGKDTSQQTTHYTYDALDRLISVETDDISVCFTYDPLHRRLSKTVYDKHSKTQSQLHFLYDGQNEIGAYDSQGKLVQLRILGQGKGAEIAAAIAIELNGRIFAPIHDLFGNVSKLISLDGTCAESYRYSAFGEHQATSEGQELNNPWRFSSKRYDPETQLVYYGRRYYDPELGRWISPDPKGFTDGPNLYAFVKNTPLLKLDLYGLDGEVTARPPVPEENWMNFVARLGGPITELIRGTGFMIEQVGFHLIPLPLVRQWTIQIGRFMRGEFSPFREEHSYVTVHGDHAYDGKDVFVLSNGILTGSPESITRSQDCLKENGNAFVVEAYNSTHGFLLDFLECVVGKLGMETSSERRLREANEIAFLLSHPTDGKVYNLVFSQAAISIDNADLPSSIRKRMEVHSFGGATLIPQSKFGWVENYISTRDVVPMLDPIDWILAYFGKDPSVHFLSGEGIPLLVHSYNSKTYSDQITKVMRRILNKE